MRFRAFSASIVLFLLIYFSSLFVISTDILRGQLESGKQQALSAHYHIASSFGRDIAALSARPGGTPEAVQALLHQYGRNYLSGGTALDVYTNEGIIVQNIHGDAAFAALKPQAGQRDLRVEQIGGAHYARVSGEIPGSGRTYFLQILYDISPYIDVWRGTVTTSVVTGVFFCSALSVLFLLLLQWVFRPMRLVSAASRQIAGGMYERRIRVTGKGEHAEMAESFNRMADAVESSIAELAEHARRRQEFADNLAHELRTPMTSIYGYAQYLRAAHLGEEERIGHYQQATDLGATPDGRRAGEKIPANYSPSLFFKQKGPMSVIKSFTKPDLTKTINGGPLTLEFDQSVFRNEESIEKLGMLVKTFITLGGHQIQLNTVNREKLLDARKHPENYRNLIVRVWGWSGYFVELEECYQDHVISRIEFGL